MPLSGYAARDGFHRHEDANLHREEEASYSVVCNPLRSVMVNQTKIAKSRKQSYLPSPGRWAKPQTRLTPAIGEDRRGEASDERAVPFLPGLTAT